MRSPVVAFLLLAPLALGGGTCGSVIRAHVPEQWETGEGGNFVHTFDGARLEVTGLVRREGVSFMRTTVTNLGAQPLRVLGAELIAGTRRDSWTAGDITVAPGATTPFLVEFMSIVSERRCAVVLRLSTGELRIEMGGP